MSQLPLFKSTALPKRLISNYKIDAGLNKRIVINIEK